MSCRSGTISPGAHHDTPRSTECATQSFRRKALSGGDVFWVGDVSASRFWCVLRGGLRTGFTWLFNSTKGSVLVGPAATFAAHSSVGAA